MLMKIVRKKVNKKPASRVNVNRYGINTRGVRETIKAVDTQFLAVIYILLAIGLLMVLSASSPIAFASSST